MKIFKIMFLAGLFAFICTGLKAQTIRIDTSEISFENKLRPCLVAKVDPEPKVVKKAWYKYLKKNYEVRLSGISLFSNKDLLTGEDVTIAAISSKRMNFYTRVTETASGSEIKTFASFGYDIFIGPVNYSKEFDAMKGIMNRFLLEYLNEYYNDEIEATAKRIKSLNKERLSLQKTIDKNNKQIMELTGNIAALNAVKNTDPEEAIRTTEKLNKQLDEKLKLQNENNKSSIDINLIDEKLTLRKEKLEKINAKHKKLIHK